MLHTSFLFVYQLYKHIKGRTHWDLDLESIKASF